MLGAAVLAAGCGSAAAPAPDNGGSFLDPQAEAASTPVLEWSDCGDGFQCATATVPLDYADPHGATASLALLKRPAADPARRIGSLFVNYGGPGASGVTMLRASAMWNFMFSDEMRARFDLVSWDPRAVARSTAVRCFATEAEKDAYLANFPRLPSSAAAEPAFYAASNDLARRCAARAGALLPHMSTVNTARDLDLLRRAVGDQQLYYHGISYGTYVGAVYANLFPGRAKALVLDGSLDFAGNSVGHDGQGTTMPVDARQGVAQGIAGTFDQFIAQCQAAGPPGCAFGAGDVKAKWAALADRVRAHPITIRDDKGAVVRYDYSALIGLAGPDLSNPVHWRQTAQTLQRLYDTPPDAPELPVTVAATGTSEPNYVDNSVEAYNAIQCADSVVPRDQSVYSALAPVEDRKVPWFGRVSVFNTMTCAYWPQVAVQPYAGPWNRHTAGPVLVVNSRYDPATSLAGAQAGLRELGRGALLVVEGAGHSTLNVHSRCAVAVEERYLVSGALPAAGATCPIDDPPFAD
ncbi:MAG: alpha/beta fold hydrolase [Mycobacteriaceae bacterium]|nr:alpha/beta fold hydrolase [Mycobacteriaceae bacterium]